MFSHGYIKWMFSTLPYTWRATLNDPTWCRHSITRNMESYTEWCYMMQTFDHQKYGELHWMMLHDADIRSPEIWRATLNDATWCRHSITRNMESYTEWCYMMQTFDHQKYGELHWMMLHDADIRSPEIWRATLNDATWCRHSITRNMESYTEWCYMMQTFDHQKYGELHWMILHDADIRSPEIWRATLNDPTWCRHSITRNMESYTEWSYMMQTLDHQKYDLRSLVFLFCSDDFCVLNYSFDVINSNEDYTSTKKQLNQYVAWHNIDVTATSNCCVRTYIIKQ